MDDFLAPDDVKDATMNRKTADQDAGKGSDTAVRSDQKLAAQADAFNDVNSKDNKRKSVKLGSGADSQVKEDNNTGDEKQSVKKARIEVENEGTEDEPDNLPDNTLEQGRVFFMYKPKVVSAGDEPFLSDLNDIQRTYLLLQPQQPSGHKSRLLVLPKKKLPDPARHERFFAFVEAVADSPSALTSGLTEAHYQTKTKGERVQPAARAVAEGPYVIAKGGHRGGVHWGYKLEVPQEPGEAQRLLGIREEGSFVLSAKNPDKQGQPGAPSAGPPPEYSPEQREQFQGRSWIGVEDTSLLDVAGTELLLVGAEAEPIEKGELGDAGDLLQQLSDEDQDKLHQPEQQEAVLKEALEPAEAAGNDKDSVEADKGGEAIPVEPAVTGKLV